MLGIFSSLGFLPIPFAPSNTSTSSKPKGRTSGYDDEPESSEEEISEGEGQHAPNWGGAVAGSEKKGEKEGKGGEVAVMGGDKNEECKLVLVVRTDLGMTKGTPPSQLNHTTVEKRALMVLTL